MIPLFQVKTRASSCTNQTNFSQIPIISSNDIVFHFGNASFLSGPLALVLIRFEESYEDLWMTSPCFFLADSALIMNKASFSWTDSQTDNQNPILKEQVSFMNVLGLSNQSIYQLLQNTGDWNLIPLISWMKTHFWFTEPPALSFITSEVFFMVKQ